MKKMKRKKGIKGKSMEEKARGGNRRQKEARGGKRKEGKLYIFLCLLICCTMQKGRHTKRGTARERVYRNRWYYSVQMLVVVMRRQEKAG